MKPRLICDVDGVLVDYHGALLNVLNVHGFAYRMQDVTHFDHAGWMCDEAFKLFEAYVMDPDGGYEFYRDLELLPGANRLMPGGDLYNRFEIIYTTASNKTPEWIKARFQWFVEYGVNPSRQVIFCPTEHKQYIDGSYLLDDNLETVVSWSDDNIYRQGLLVDQPWNRGKLGDAKRFYSTSDACAYLDILERHAKVA